MVTCMMLIGAATLAEYVARRPEASPALRALNVLVRQAIWTTSDDLARSCSAIMRLDRGGMALLELREAGCEVVLKINYDLGVVRVIAVRDLRGQKT
jgi:mRNA-degrading endonuclease HigB of HigAB toxin-antitoxin module